MHFHIQYFEKIKNSLFCQYLPVSFSKRLLNRIPPECIRRGNFIKKKEWPGVKIALEGPDIRLRGEGGAWQESRFLWFNFSTKISVFGG